MNKIIALYLKEESQRACEKWSCMQINNNLQNYDKQKNTL